MAPHGPSRPPRKPPTIHERAALPAGCVHLDGLHSVVVCRFTGVGEDSTHGKGKGKRQGMGMGKGRDGGACFLTLVDLILQITCQTGNPLIRCVGGVVVTGADTHEYFGPCQLVHDRLPASRYWNWT